MKQQQSNIRIITPLLFSFFVMGFVDIVGIAVSYIEQDFELSNTRSNMIPSMVFLWFAVCSIPIGSLMRRIGRKHTVMLSAVITMVALLMPMISYSVTAILLAFVMLGIGNTILQVSLNPLLVQNVADSRVAGMLTFGQFVKAVSSSLGPLLVGLCASFLGSWRVVFYVYAVLTMLSFVWLWCVDMASEKYDNSVPTGVYATLSLLKIGYIRSLFAIIVLSVGFEVGLMTVVPKFFTERFSLPLEVGGLGCTFYFVARTVGTFIGVILLSRINIRRFFRVSVILGITSLVAFIFAPSPIILLVSLFCVGLFCSNVFAIIFAEALYFKRESINELSALMIVGVGGGALLPPIMGIIADNSSQQLSLIVPLGALIYILTFALFAMRKTK